MTRRLAAALAGVAVVVGGVLTFIAVREFGEQENSPEAPPPTLEAATATATASPAVTSTPAATATASPAAASTVVGLFTEPRALPVASRELGPPGREFPPPDLPPPTFAWDGTSTMVYDRQTGHLIDLGRGEPGAFSASGEWFAWVSEDRFSGTLHALNLQDGTRNDLGPGGYVSLFIDEERMLVDIVGAEGVLVNVRTGEREPVSDRSQLFATFEARPFRIESEYVADAIQRVRVFDVARNEAFELAVRAYQPTTDRELLIATVPENGLSNIFTIDLDARLATFVATTPVSPRGFTMSGNRTHIAWSPDICTDPGETWVFERTTAEFTRAPRALFVSAASQAPDGLLGTGFTGLERLIDPETMDYVFISPAGAGWPRWSQDLRYVSVGEVGGHGGFCS